MERTVKIAGSKTLINERKGAMTSLSYIVRITGRVDRVGVPATLFQNRPGQLFVSDRIRSTTSINGRNLFEVGLLSTNSSVPLPPTGRGAVVFASDNNLVPTRRSLDSVFQSFDSRGSILTTRQDSRLSGRSINSFAGSFLFGTSVVEGVMTVRFQNNANRIVGRISLAGRRSLAGTFETSYNATFSGQLVSTNPNGRVSITGASKFGRRLKRETLPSYANRGSRSTERSNLASLSKRDHSTSYL